MMPGYFLMPLRGWKAARALHVHRTQVKCLL